jgi:hypothetical protein
MRKLFFEIMALTFFVTLVMFIVEHKYKNYSTHIDVIMNKVLKNASMQNIYYIGNSHAGALGNSFLNKNAINLSYAGMNPYQMKEILFFLVKNSGKANIIILNIDYDFVGKYTVSDVANLQFYKYTGSLPESNFATKFMASSNYFRSGQDYKFLFEKKQDIREQNFTPISNQSTINDKDCESKAFELGVATFNENQVKKNKEILLDMIFVAKKYQGKIIFVCTPKRSCLLNAYVNYISIQKAKSITDSLFTSNSIYYLDCTNNTAFTDLDFVDYDHLNTIGALKMQMQINKKYELVNN